jgi:hypothetical protein
LACAAFILALAGAACTSNAKQTPIYVFQTPSPIPATQAPTQTTIVVEPTVPPPATPRATITPWPTIPPTPVPTPPPTPGKTPVSSAGPTSPAGVCTGGPKNQSFFVNAANSLKFAVYCATLGSGWSLGTAHFDIPKAGGWVAMTYTGPGGATIVVSEGAFCLTSAAACAPNSGNLGSGSFGGLSGRLYSISGGFAIYVNPGTTHAYSITGHNVTQGVLQAAAAGLKVVSKS